MTERRAILLAGGAHLVLLAALSLSWAMQDKTPINVAEPIPVDVVDISDIARITEPPKPSMDAAPQETVEATSPDPPAPQERTTAQETPAERVPTPTPDPAPTPAPTPTPPKPSTQATQNASAAQRRAPERLDAQELANLIDKSLPRAPTRTRDPSDFAKSIERALPKGAKIDARATAQLQQAIYAQLKPCWNPPLGGEGAGGLAVILNVRYSREGAVVGRPEVVEVAGAGGASPSYVETFRQAALRTVLNPRCAPLKLPVELYDAWREIELRISASMMT